MREIVVDEYIREGLLMKAMAYIKQTACSDMSLQEFTKEWGKMTPAEQEELREWARAEGKVLGREVE